MAQVIEPTNDAGYMVANRIELVLASPGASIYGQLKLATALKFFQYRFPIRLGVVHRYSHATLASCNTRRYSL